MYPGRWNDPGTPALYASPEIGTAALEVLSHLPKDVIPRGYALMKIRLNLVGTVVFTESSLADDFSAVTIEASGKTHVLVPEVDNVEGPFIQIFRDFAAAESVFGWPFTEQPHWGIKDVYWGSFAVFVPSAILPAYSVVLFPGTRGFRQYVSIETVEPFDFHSALFQATAKVAPE
jgi:RES domain